MDKANSSCKGVIIEEMYNADNVDDVTCPNYPYKRFLNGWTKKFLSWNKQSNL